MCRVCIIALILRDISVLYTRHSNPGFILCSVLNWRTPSHYIFIRQENDLFDSAHLLCKLA